MCLLCLPAKRQDSKFMTIKFDKIPYPRPLMRNTRGKQDFINICDGSLAPPLGSNPYKEREFCVENFIIISNKNFTKRGGVTFL